MDEPVIRYAADPLVVQRDSLPEGLQGPRLRDLLSGASERRAVNSVQVELAPYGVKLLTR